MSETSGRMITEDGSVVNVADTLGGVPTGTTKKIKSYMPKSGRILDEDGNVINLADLLGGTPVGKVSNVNSYAPSSGCMVKEDGTVVNVAKALKEKLSGGGGGTDWLQWKLDNTQSARSCFESYTGEFPEGMLESLDFSNVREMTYCFKNSSLPKSPELNFASCTSATGTFAYCRSLTGNVVIKGLANTTSLRELCESCLQVENIYLENTKKVTDYYYAFLDCRAAKSISTINLINKPTITYMLTNCMALENLVVINIKQSLQIGSASSWGHLLNLDSILNAIKECHNMTDSTAITLTIGTANKDKIADVYVKLIDITDEMRAEDEYIDLKLPFEVCESTDEGAMLVSDYALALKNVNIA